MKTKTPYRNRNITSPTKVHVRLSNSERDYVKAVSAAQNLTLRELLLDSVNKFAEDKPE